MNNLTTITLLLTGLLFSSCGHNSFVIDASGAFEAVEILVSAEATGQIVELNLLEGESIEEGSIVGRIDTRQLELKKEQLLASSESLKSRIVDVVIQTASLKEQVDTVKKEKRRIENLLKSDAVNTKQLDDINGQLAALEKQLYALTVSLQNGNDGINNELIALDSQIAQMDDQIGKGTIVSPISGTVLVKYAERGELAMMGKALFKIADLDQMYLRAYITSGQLTQVRLGQDVTVLSDLGEGEYKSVTGKISWISDKAEFTPKTVQTKDERANLTYAVKVAVPNDGFLKIGMYGGIKFEG
jgi:HlyD family secretion protein